MLADLHVWHLRKTGDGAAPSKWGDAQDLFTLETCQRWIAVAHGEARFIPDATEYFQGVDAYAFLLRMACGLESQMRAETEVFGQIKGAWSAYAVRRAPQSAVLAPIFQKLFEDAKSIRRTHLQNLGQASYGSLLRRILGQAPLKRPVLVLGSGAFAQSLLPWLASFDVHLTNRTAARAERVAAALQAPGAPFQKNPITVVPWEQALESIATQPCHVVSCVPGGNATLLQRLELWALRAPQGTLFFDLGENVIVPAAVTTVTLNDFYALQKQEENLRTLEVQRALHAIDGLAARRDATMHITLSHGWEDLWSHGA